MLEKIKGGLVVSCQALPDEPLYSSFIMGRMALAAKQAGAVGIRAQSKADILEIKQVVDLPVIGIIKRNYPNSDVYITATKKELDELFETKCEMVAMDATQRVRPNHEQLADLVTYAHAHGVLTMADCSTFEECVDAQRIGFDCVSTTLCGYTPYSLKLEGPDINLIKQLSETIHIPILAEGKINTPQDLIDVYQAGAYSAVVGGAITRPQQIAERFINVLNS